ncbi:MAG: LL-diaminopimelate aminotransferase [Gracilibacteraceae bacterium]|jgi:LL-diaminopimelate aminotransferase|nr:LL-diaminopimelate aminotransferase [Gracilibacteraceae bacterium]
MTELAERMKNLPPYLFARIDEKIAEAKARGVDVISLGIGDPDLPTPKNIIDKMAAEIYKPEHHQYPSYAGMLSYRQAVAEWYRRRRGVELDPQTEVLTLIGSKEGIAHISLCYIEPGAIALVPDPGYPVYEIGCMLAGGQAYKMPLRAENGFLPVFEDIPSAVAAKARLLFLNYPNNPTAAVADEAFYRKAIAFAREYDIIICHDGAYSEIGFDGYRPLSFLELPGAKETGIEFNSLSKGYNMTGWRIAWAAGRSDVIRALGTVKSNIDSGAFQAVQAAGIEALLGPQDIIPHLCAVYQERRDIVVDTLNAMGWRMEKTRAAVYIWAPVPKGFTSESFAEFVLEKAGVVVTPGNGYGAAGEGYVRLTLTIDTQRLREALRRMRDSLGAVSF